MTSAPNNDDQDPELADISALGRVERGRAQANRRVRVGSTILILLAVLVLLVLAAASLWVVMRD